MAAISWNSPSQPYVVAWWRTCPDYCVRIPRQQQQSFKAALC